MLPKGQRHRSVRAEYRATRGVEPPAELPIPVLDLDDDGDTQFDAAAGVRSFAADPAAAGRRVDQYLAHCLPDISRARVQLLIESGQVRVDGKPAKAKQKLNGGEAIEIEGEPQPAPLHAVPEDIPLEILFEDQYLAVVNKPAGMMVHAGAGSSDDERNRGTLVNAVLFHLGKLSEVGGELRPGIVHRLDKQTSGIIVVAKDDVTHRKLGEMFSERRVEKTYLALVHGQLAKDKVTVSLAISRDLIRRTRMTTRRSASDPGARSAVSHVTVLERMTTPYGPFTLVQVHIETGRTHQIRVHMQSLGHPVVGDFLYGAPHRIHAVKDAEQAAMPDDAVLELERNFLHAAHLEFVHPRTSQSMDLQCPLPPDLTGFLARLRGEIEPKKAVS
jgi:23S rRNA pseudouridine1911/1915/1917 synthase